MGPRGGGSQKSIFGLKVGGFAKQDKKRELLDSRKAHQNSTQELSLSPFLRAMLPMHQTHPNLYPLAGDDRPVVGRCCRGALLETGSQDPVTTRVPT